ncbi:MAG: mismatch-specific DNA-glycosylase [Pyrinomonadaceae bacterium]
MCVIKRLPFTAKPNLSGVVSRHLSNDLTLHATATAAELTKEDFIAGGRALAAKVKRYRPRVVAILGVGAYRDAFAKPKAQIGEQPERIHDARVWVLPNPSGLNANYQLPELVRLFRSLRNSG